MRAAFKRLDSVREGPADQKHAGQGCGQPPVWLMWRVIWPATR